MIAILHHEVDLQSDVFGVVVSRLKIFGWRQKSLRLVNYCQVVIIGVIHWIETVMVLAQGATASDNVPDWVGLCVHYFHHLITIPVTVYGSTWVCMQVALTQPKFICQMSEIARLLLFCRRATRTSIWIFIVNVGFLQRQMGSFNYLILLFRNNFISCRYMHFALKVSFSPPIFAQDANESNKC